VAVKRSHRNHIRVARTPLDIKTPLSSRGQFIYDLKGKGFDSDTLRKQQLVKEDFLRMTDG